MKILKPITNRFVLVSLALVAQIAFLAVVSNCFEEAAPVIHIIVRILSVAVVAVILNESSNPQIKLTWIIFVLISPVFGSVFYVLTGGKRPRRWLLDACTRAQTRNRKYHKLNKEAFLALEKEDADLHIQSKYLEKQGFPLCGNTRAEYFSIGEDAFEAMLEQIEKAEKFIFMEFFIFDKGEMFDRIKEILERKAKEGVEVRIIYDDMGSLFTLPHKYYEELEAKGIKCIAFNPFVPFISAAMNNRDHRKILVIDSRVAFTGGINIADEYINKKEKYGHWKDNAVMIEGEGAKEFTLLFLDMWTAFRDKDENIQKFLDAHSVQAQGYVQPFSDSPLDDELVSESVYMNAINNAKEYIYIYTPYLVPDNELIFSLSLAAKRGVDVRLIVPGIPDKKIVYLMTKSYFGLLIEAGVEIYKYPPGFVHAKGFVCDGNVACAGTVNLDFRSLHHHFECGCMFYNSPVVASMKADMDETLKVCEKITRYQRVRGIIGSTYHALLRFIAPLM